MKEIEGLLLDKKDLARCKKVIEESIRDMVAECSCRGVVLGISGGVDSAVVLKLAHGAGVNVHALIMPEEGMTRERDVEDATSMARDLGIKYSVIKINPVLAALEKAFPWSDFPAEKKRLSLGNAKARIRMVLNYLAANLDARLVLGTGNRTEILLGYATKYGDCGVDMQPIGELYKTQVLQMAEYVGVPGRIIGKVPTAGLWKGQTDEGELGASYREMDMILHFLVDRKMTAVRTAKELSADEKLVKRLSMRIAANVHKRRAPPVTKLFDQA